MSRARKLFVLMSNFTNNFKKLSRCASCKHYEVAMPRMKKCFFFSVVDTNTKKSGLQNHGKLPTPGELS